jgi:hypothetical protein
MRHYHDSEEHRLPELEAVEKNMVHLIKTGNHPVVSLKSSTRIFK